MIGELIASHIVTGGVEFETRGMGTEYSVHAMLWTSTSDGRSVDGSAHLATDSVGRCLFAVMDI